MEKQNELQLHYPEQPTKSCSTEKLVFQTVLTENRTQVHPKNKNLKSYYRLLTPAGRFLLH